MRIVRWRAGGPERVAVGRGEEDERLGVVLDLAADRDEHRLVVADQADDVVAGDVVRGDDGDLRPVEVGVEVERDESGVGVGRADRRAVPGTGEDEVVGVLRLAGELRRALAAERSGGTRPAGRDLAGGDDERIRGAALGCDGRGGPGWRCPDRHAVGRPSLAGDDSTG